MSKPDPAERTARMWNALPQHERLLLLRHCKTVMAESIKQHESTLTWDELWPMRQDELSDLDSDSILRRKEIER